MKKEGGLTFYLCFGRWGRPGIRIDKGFQLVLGFVSIGIWKVDIELRIYNIISVLDNQNAEIKRLGTIIDNAGAVKGGKNVHIT